MAERTPAVNNDQHLPAWPPDPGLRGLAVPPATSQPHTTTSLHIAILGTFTINGQPAAPQPAQGKLLLALAMAGPDGLDNDQLRYLLGASPDHPLDPGTLRKQLQRTRHRLGPAPGGGWWVSHLGGGQYVLHPATRFDWDEFQDLTARGLAAGDRALLRQATMLIRGHPLRGCDYWWEDLPVIAETIRIQVITTARALARLEEQAGNPAACITAVSAALRAGQPDLDILQLLYQLGEQGAA